MLQIEILFQRGLVRVLFATETLAVGLNMPARTVVFTDIKKHDGERTRVLHAAEYTQVQTQKGDTSERRHKQNTKNCLLSSPFMHKCLLFVSFLSLYCLLIVSLLSPFCLFTVSFLSLYCLLFVSFLAPFVSLLSPFCLFIVSFLSPFWLLFVSFCLFTVSFLSLYCLLLSPPCLLFVSLLSLCCLLLVS